MPTTRFAALLAVAALSCAGAARATTISFLSGPPNGGNWGNSLTFSGGGISVTASAYAETGSESPLYSGWYLFQTGQIYRWATGLGICNRYEGLANQNCSDTEHEVDTVGRDDVLVFMFDQVVNFQSLTVDPYNSSGSDPNDRDIVYWVGTVGALPALTGETFATLGAMAGITSETWNQVSSGFNPYTHSLSGTGNLLLVSGNYHDRNCKNADVTENRECEAYKIADITVTQVVPAPAAGWLLGSAVGVFGLIRRRGRPAG